MSNKSGNEGCRNKYRTLLGGFREYKLMRKAIEEYKL
jgi:hypothetical protein